MTYATVKVYSLTDLADYKNWIVEDIAGFLSGQIPVHVDTKFNYVKQKLNLTLPLNIPKTALNFASNNVNYVSIQNGTEKIVYYFVTQREWMSDDAVRLSLRMDTLNTFPLGTSFTASPRTHITREHKNFLKTKTVTSKIVTRKYTVGDLYGYEKALFFGPGNDCTDPARVTIFTSPASSPENTYTVEKEIEYGGTDFTGVRINITHLTGTFTLSIYMTYEYDYIDIDDFPEGILPVLRNKKEKTVLSGENQNWYLMYRNGENQQSEAVDCFLVSENSLPVRIPTSATRVTTDSFFTYKYAVADPFTSGSFENPLIFGAKLYDAAINPETGLPDPYYGEGTLKAEWQNRVSYTANTEYYTMGSFILFLFENDTVNNKIIVRKIDASLFEYYKDSSGFVCNHAYWRLLDEVTCDYVTFSEMPIRVKLSDVLTNLPSTDPLNMSNARWPVPPDPSDPDFAVVNTKGISGIDRTDSKLLKIIALPYLPINFQPNDGLYDITGIFYLDDTLDILKFIDVNMPFNYSLPNSIVDPARLIIPKASAASTARIRDPKTFRSEFFVEKLVYDSFSIDLPLENRAKTATKIDKLNIEYSVTKTMNSRFMFIATNWRANERQNAHDNYPGVLIVARNNEITLYNSAYLNYIRTGYNYDVKAKDRAIVSSLIGGAAGVATGAIQMATQQPFGAMTVLSTLTNTINSITAAEDSVARRLKDSESQAISVSGSDDIDLLQIYAGNRAKVVQYQCSDAMLKAIDDLFYFCGYACDKYAAPAMNAKLHFDFCQCDLVFETLTDYIPDECKEDIRRRFSEGVTKFHKITGTPNAWFFTQTENNNIGNFEYSISETNDYKYPEIPLEEVIE